jgi:hypothetical protein
MNFKKADDSVESVCFCSREWQNFLSLCFKNHMACCVLVWRRETLVVVMDFAQEFIDSAACGVQCEMLMGSHAAKAFN